MSALKPEHQRGVAPTYPGLGQTAGVPEASQRARGGRGVAAKGWEQWGVTAQGLLFQVIRCSGIVSWWLLHTSVNISKALACILEIGGFYCM